MTTSIRQGLRTKNHIYSYILPKDDYLLLIITTIATIANGIVPAITSILTGRVFDILELVFEEGDNAIHKELTVRSMAIMALGLACFPLMWMSVSLWMEVGERQGSRIRKEVIKSYLSKPLEWYDKNDEMLGQFTQVNRCIEELRSSSAESSAIIFQNLVAMVALIGTSLYYSWSLTLVILCSSPIIIIIAIIFSRLTNKFTENENYKTSEAAELLTRSMNAIKLIKLYCTQDYEIKKFNQLVKECNKEFIKACVCVSVNASLLRFLTLSMFVQGFWFGTTMIRKGKLNIADVITCFHSCLMLGSTLNNSLHQIVLLQKGDVAMKKIANILDGPQKLELTKVEDFSLAQFNNCDITFKSVSFCYPTRLENQVLNCFSNTFPSGKMTFIVGKSGSGKSTLSNLLLKLYNEYQGEIFIGSTPLQNINEGYLRSNITFVEQRCELFNGTLKENILIGNQNNEQVQIRLQNACKFALLNSFIDALPHGLNTIIGDGGITLSGGQQQKIAIARAFIRDTPILILDEAVSALDISQKRVLMESIRKWRKDRTTLFLTHDLNELKPDDYICIVGDGMLKEAGFKSDLLVNPNSEFVLLSSNLSKETISNATTVSESKEKISRLTKVDSLDCSNLTLSSSNSSNTYISFNNSIQSEDRCINEDDVGLKVISKEEGIKLVSLGSLLYRMISMFDKKRFLLIGLFCSLLAGITNPIFSYTFSYLLNGIVPNRDSSIGSNPYLVKWSFVVIGISGADGIFNFLKSFILGYCSETWIMQLRKEVMHRIIHNSYEWFGRPENKPSEISALMMNDTRDLRSLVTEFLSGVTTLLVIALCGLIWALVSGWKLSLVCISMFPLIILFSSIYGSVLQKLETNYKTMVAQLENCDYEIITSVKTIRIFRAESQFLASHYNKEESMQYAARRRGVITGLGIATINMITMCIQAILYYYGLKLVLDGEYTSKRMFETFTLLLFTVMTCTSLINQIPEISRGQRAASIIFRMLDEFDTTKEISKINGRIKKIAPSLEDNDLIIFSKLSFSYPSNPTVTVCRNLDIRFSLNESVAIVGESGCGKSTIISLLMGLFPVDFKSIYVDRTDINDWDLDCLRSQISIVEQHPTFFSGSIRDNLLYGITRNIMEVELYDALKRVHIFDFIQTLRDGLDTKVDTTLLSGGQLQRLCIARSLLKNSKILILDECTSALDPLSTSIINELVSSGIPDTLIIAITHSEDMMRSCTRVVVLQDGTVADKGRYQNMLKK